MTNAEAAVPHLGEAPHDLLDLLPAGAEELVRVPSAASSSGGGEDCPERVCSAEVVPVAPELSELHGDDSSLPWPAPSAAVATIARGTVVLFRRTGLSFDDIGVFDDIALRTFLDPPDGGVDRRCLGLASGANVRLVERIGAYLRPDVAFSFHRALASSPSPTTVQRARSRVLEQLVWPLVYWTRPDDFDDLVWRNGSPIACSTSSTWTARSSATSEPAPGGSHPPRLDVRGAFRALPLADRCVDVAVACSSFMTAGPHGGPTAPGEAERIVVSGGGVAIIWPQDAGWLRRHGLEHVQVAANPCHSFRDQATAERLCATCYSDAAAAWVREHHARDVPYSVLGSSLPNDVCIKRRD